MADHNKEIYQTSQAKNEAADQLYQLAKAGNNNHFSSLIPDQ